MLFVYPAIISDKVSNTYLPGIVKTLEMYFLDKILSDVADHRVKFVVSKSRVTGKYSDIRMESKLLCENLGYDTEEIRNLLSEQSLPSKSVHVAEIAETERSLSDARGNADKYLETVETTRIRLADAKAKYETCMTKIAPYEKAIGQTGQKKETGETTEPIISQAAKARAGTQCATQRRLMDQAEAELQNAENKLSIEHNTISSLERRLQDQTGAKRRYDYEVQKIADEEKKEKKADTLGGATDLRVDSQIALDLRPTTATVKVQVGIKSFEKMTSVVPDIKQEERTIPISVKVVPIIAHNFNDIYTAMKKDFFSNKFSHLFKATSRKLMSAGLKWASPLARKLFALTKDKENVNVYKDIILSKTGIINASPYKSGGSSAAKSDRYSAAIVVFSSDDFKNQHSPIFKDPNKLQSLYQLGWKVFAIADDKDQELTLCSGLEGGAMCSKIPYSYMYKTLQAQDLFKDADQLSRFTSRVIGNFKKTNFKKITSEATMIDMMSKQKVQELFNKFGG